MKTQKPDKKNHGRACGVFVIGPDTGKTEPTFFHPNRLGHVREGEIDVTSQCLHNGTSGVYEVRMTFEWNDAGGKGTRKGQIKLTRSEAFSLAQAMAEAAFSLPKLHRE